jgi:hypothetical protein
LTLLGVLVVFDFLAPIMYIYIFFLFVNKFLIIVNYLNFFCNICIYTGFLF